MSTAVNNDVPTDIQRALAAAGTGDLFFMNRKCLAMKDPLGIGLCLLTKTENRFDHVGMIVKLSPKDIERHYKEAGKKIAKPSPSGTYCMETNMKGVTLLAAEDRIGRSSAHEIVLRPLRLGSAETQKRSTTRMLEELESMYQIPYQSDVRHIIPFIFSPPDKMDRIDAAHKIHQLEHEIQLIDRALASKKDVPVSHVEPYEQLRDVYKNSQRFLAETYFPHLPLGRKQPGQYCDPREWHGGHFWFDGANQASRMVCSELICNLWQRTGLLNGFAPASSNRPFDLLDDTRMNFIGDRVGFAALAPLKVTGKARRFWEDGNVNNGLPTPLVCVTESEPMPTAVLREVTFESERLRFVNDIRAHHRLTTLNSIEEVAETTKSGALLPFRWLVQSTWSKQVEADLPFRLAGCGVLFAVCAIPMAPLTLRWVESQCGLFLVRGSLWSLASGLLARNLAFAAAQGLLAWAALPFIANAPHTDSAAHTVFHGVSSSSSLVDTRHPYYTVVATMAASALGAHIITAPIFNSTISYHFGPLRPGPLPLRLLCRGCFSMAPLAVVLPYQAYWLSWYETGSSFIIPTRSSVLRERHDLLQDPRWPHFRNDALVGCFAFTCVLDALMYPLRTMSVRRLMKGLYAPQATPSFGPRWFPGYRYRALSNTLIFGLTTTLLHVGALL